MKMPMRIVSWGPRDWNVTNFPGLGSLWGISSASSDPQVGLPHCQPRG